MTKHLVALDVELLLSSGFKYGDFDNDYLWKKGSDGNDWCAKVTLWSKKMEWYKTTETTPLIPMGYMTRETFDELFNKNFTVRENGD